MFAGIVSDTGRIMNIEKKGDFLYTISSNYQDIEVGNSISCSGVCLTVVKSGTDSERSWFSVNVSQETLNCTTIGKWNVGSIVNLEKSLVFGGRIEGHFVSGHIDGVAKVIKIKPEKDSLRFTFEPPMNLMKYIVTKGSVALNGISLTINEVTSETFGVNIIPHTRNETNFRNLKENELVNLEIDILARYLSGIVTKNK
tara:strand:+ start:175 stop:771 length:597 start_codon:yes stop_codon:yes gene_type:complete